MVGAEHDIDLPEIAMHLPSLGLPDRFPDFSERSPEDLGHRLESELQLLLNIDTFTNTKSPQASELPIDDATITLDAAARVLAKWQAAQGYEAGMAYSLGVRLPLVFEGAAEEGQEAFIFETYYEPRAPVDVQDDDEEEERTTHQTISHVVQPPPTALQRMFAVAHDLTLPSPEKKELKDELWTPAHKQAFGVAGIIVEHITARILEAAVRPPDLDQFVKLRRIRKPR